MKFMLQLHANTSVPTNLVQKAWAKTLWKEANKDNFFEKFTGESSDSIIQVKTDLKKDKGDQITVPLQMRLTGAGVTGNSTLEGNEEALTMYDCAVSLQHYRHAVRLAGRFEEQKTSLNLRQAAKDGLKTWLREKIEGLIVSALTASPTSEHTVFPSGVAAESSITTSNKFTTAEISKARRLAKYSTPRIRPVRTEYGEYYVMLIDPYQARDLRTDTKWIDAQKYANNRGYDNPIFTGMLGIYEGVVVHEYDNLSRTETGASNAWVGHALMMGAQAGIKAVGQEAEWHEKSFDYENQYGVSTGVIMGVAKSKFNSKDYAVIQVITSSAAD